MMNIKAIGSEKNDDIDRISSLPDEILMHILSFLSTRNAVQTCILSKRWINTWASVPDLKFNIKEFGLPEIIDDEMVVQFVSKFELLVKSVMEKRESSYVNIFRLRLDSCIYWPRTQDVADCIDDVMKLEPRKCLVKLSSCENLNLNTNFIFTCASLVYLQLCFSTENDDLVAIEPNLVNLPCLKTLNLDGFTMSNDSLKKLLLGCSVLEELVLKICYLGGVIEICSNTLKKLVLRKCYEVKRLHISTSNLMYLDIIGDTMDMLLNMPLLVDASIYLQGWYNQNEYVTMGPKLIHNFSNVESLKLKFDYPKRKVQKKDFPNFPIFNNLKSLKLVSWRFSVFDLVPYFLHHSPKLQELTLTNRSAYPVIQFADEEIIQEGPRDALVQREFLKTVRIVGFKKDNGFVDKLINKLLVYVKIIGEIDIVRRDHW